MTRLLLGIAVASLIVPAAKGTTLIDKGTFQASGYNMTDFENADNFSFSSTHSILAFRFWTTVTPDSPIYYRFYDDGASGAPGNLLGSGSATGTVTSSAGDYQIDINLPSAVTLGTGTFYLSLHEGPYNTTDGTAIFWASSGPGLHFQQANSILTAPAEPQTSNELAFQLFDAPIGVPEPSTSVLAVGAAAALMLVKRCR